MFELQFLGISYFFFFVARSFDVFFVIAVAFLAFFAGFWGKSSTCRAPAAVRLDAVQQRLCAGCLGPAQVC